MLGQIQQVAWRDRCAIRVADISASRITQGRSRSGAGWRAGKIASGGAE